MRYLKSIPLFAIMALAQNQFPDPDVEPTQELGLGIKIPFENFTAEVLPFAESLVTVNTSVVALDKAIIAFEGQEQVQSTLNAADGLLQTLNDANDDLSALPKITNSTENQGNVVDLIPYSNSLSYYVNHTVVNLVLKKDLAVQLCQGLAVFQAVEAQQSAASAFIDTITSKVPDELASNVPDIVQPILDALSSASSAFADQTALPESCSSISSSNTATGTSTTTSGDEMTSTSTTDGEIITLVYPGGTQTTYGNGAVTPTGNAGTTYPTGWSGYPIGGDDDDKGNAHPSYSESGKGSYSTDSYSKPSGSSHLGAYTGSAATNSVQSGSVAFAALVAIIIM